MVVQAISQAAGDGNGKADYSAKERRHNLIGSGAVLEGRDKEQGGSHTLVKFGTQVRPVVFRLGKNKVRSKGTNLLRGGQNSHESVGV